MNYVFFHLRISKFFCLGIYIYFTIRVISIAAVSDWLLFMQKFSSLLLLRLAFQSLGVVYGDLGTSPLYVFYNTFPHGIKDSEDVIGALSLIIYSLTLIPLLKYVFIVCRANDNGQGKLIYTYIYIYISYNFC